MEDEFFSFKIFAIFFLVLSISYVIIALNWQYLGNGKVQPSTITDTTNCYGIISENSTPNKIGDIIIKANSVLIVLP